MICVNSVSVCPKNVFLKTGDWYYDAYAEVCPLDADCREVTWHSENPSVANVNASTGYIHANAIGTTKIYATATDGSECSDYLTVTVSNTVPVASITLNRSNISLEECGSTSLFATVCPENASNKNVNWTSSDSSVATVSNSGLVTAVSIGSAIITATAADGSGHCDCCTVTVTESILVSDICVSPSEINLKVNDSCYLYETVTPSNASNKNVAWHSDNTSVALVNSSGLVYANGVGSATIYATAQDGSGVCGSCDVSVSSLPVSSVSVCPDKKTLSVNDITTLCAIITPFNATNLSVEWTSSDTSVATVGRYTGIVTAKSKGTAIITARTVDGNKTDTCTITVDSREKVIIEKEPHTDYSRIVFGKGKIWNCINVDVINEYSLSVKDHFSWRFYDNTYQTKVYDSSDDAMYYYEPMKEYTDDEIKLIYTIDPYGLAGYVEKYASHLYDEGTNLQDKLSRSLGYKDYVFSLLFNREPKYYKRNISGEWYETTDKSNLSAVLSESEYLFGRHQIYDIFTLHEFITVVIDIFSMAIQCPALKSLSFISKIAKVVSYYSLARSVGESLLNSDFNGFVSDIAEGLVDEDDLDDDFITPSTYKSKNFTLGWAYELLSFSSDLNALAETFNSGPHFYKDIFEKCNEDLESYNILIRTTDDELISISEINNVID